MARNTDRATHAKRDKVTALDTEHRNRSYDHGYMDGSADGFRTGYKAGHADGRQGKPDRFENTDDPLKSSPFRP